MAEQGMFRISVAGFKKADVLSYIDKLISGNSHEIMKKEEENAKIGRALHESEDRIKNFEQDTKKLITEIEKLRTQQVPSSQAAVNADDVQKTFERQELLVDTLQKKISTLEHENLTLQEACQNSVDSSEVLKKNEILSTERDSYRDKLHNCQDRLVETETELMKNQRNSKQHSELMADIGAFVVELHNMGNQIISSSYTKSNESLGALEKALDILKSNLETSSETVFKARHSLQRQQDTAKERLEQLVNDLNHSKVLEVDGDTGAEL